MSASDPKRTSISLEKDALAANEALAAISKDRLTLEAGDVPMSAGEPWGYSHKSHTFS